MFISTIVLSSINKSLRLYKTSGIFYMGTFAVGSHLAVYLLQTILHDHNEILRACEFEKNILFCDVFDILNLISTLLNCIFFYFSYSLNIFF